MNWWNERPIAHRGAHRGNSIPENSLLAFSEAVRNSYHIELDLRLSLDGKAMVFHDNTLDRLCNVEGKLSEHTSGQLKKLRLLKTTHQIPLLEEALELIKGRRGVILELKNFSNQCRKLENEVIRVLSDYEGPFAIQSFNPHSLFYIKRKFNSAPIGLLLDNFVQANLEEWEKWFLQNIVSFPFIRPDFLAINQFLLPNKKVKALRWLFQCDCLSWTITSKQQQKRIQNYCTGFIFEKYYP